MEIVSHNIKLWILEILILCIDIFVHRTYHGSSLRAIINIITYS